jgi:iron complex transport system substrate-binding protein
MKLFLFNILFFLFLCSSFSCSSKIEKGNAENSIKADTIHAAFAKNFTVLIKGDLTILTIGEAWRDSKEKFQYVLYPKGSKAPNGFENAVKIAVPVERVICTGTSQVAFIDFINETEKIVAIADGKYVFNAKISSKIKSGSLPELGNDQELNYEKALNVNPELVFAFSFGRTQSHKKFEELGIPVVMISEFMEDSPLGRAEWVVFMSYFFEKSDFAQKEFDKIAKKYLEIQQMSRDIPNEQKPRLLVGMAQEGSWFLPGGKSYTAQFIEDAGGHYPWADNTEKGGIPVDFESVLYKGQDADIWLNIVLAKNKKDLLLADSRYASFKAFKNSSIYSYTARVSENGGYDFFESGIVRPDLILADLIKIFHPQKFQEHNLYYYESVKE